MKEQLDLSDRTIITTFGLVDPRKGLEYMIEAMQVIREHDPSALYLIVGKTHPELVRREGEAYRRQLWQLVKDRGLQQHVEFVDEYLSQAQIVEYLLASDVYVTPYLDPQQITSGTLAYALGAGKAIVSTPYPHATEVLTAERGILVPFRSRISACRGHAADHGRPGAEASVRARGIRLWAGDSVAASRRANAVNLADRCIRNAHRRRRSESPGECHPRVTRISLEHLQRLTRPVTAAGPAATAIAVYAEPVGPADDSPIVPRSAREQGVEGVACVDDAARGIVLYCGIWRRRRLPSAREAASRLLRFLAHMQDEDGRFWQFHPRLDWPPQSRRHDTSHAGGSAWQARALHALACASAT